MYLIVWEYEVRPDRVAEFAALYGAEGAWSGLFRRADAYRGTELYADVARPTRFVTIDRWISQAAFEAFLPTVREEYARLDQQGGTLTIRELRLGAFEADTVPR